MPRKEDIGDIPELLPDREDIQAFRGQPVAPDSLSAPVGRVRREALVGQSSSVGGRQEQRKSNFGIWLLCLLTIGAASFAGWWMYERMIDMEFMLDASRSELNHARQRLGELEALVVATDVNANKSGTVVQAQVKLLDDRTKEREKLVDAEIKKLWGVAYGTNKPAIDDTQKAVENNSVGMQQNSAQLVAIAEQLSAQQQQLATLIDAQQILSSTLSSYKSVFDGQQKMQISQARSIASQTKSLQELEASIKKLTTEHTQTSKAITRLQRDNGNLKASVKKAPPASAVEQIDTKLADLQTQLVNLQEQIRLALVLEQSASELEERLYIAEQDMRSIISFRQDTNRKLNQLETQIREIKFGQ